MSKIILSICIPTYKRGDIVAATLEHVARIEGDEVEFVVSDNASPDNTEKLVRAAASADSRIRYFRNEKNLGYDANILKLVERARGEFIFYLSDEDRLELSSIPWLLETIKQNPGVSQILGAIGKDWKTKELLFSYGDGKYAPGNDPLVKLLFKNTYISGIAVRRSAVSLEHARKYIGFMYIQQLVMGHAMLAGETLCTSRYVCYMGEKTKSYLETPKSMSKLKGISFNHPVSRVHQLKSRIRIAKDLTPKLPEARKWLIDEQRRYASGLFVWLSFRYTWHFLKLLPSILRIREVSRSSAFWKSLPSAYIRQTIIYLRAKGRGEDIWF